MSGDRLPTYFLSHGGGPWSYMDGPGRQGYAKLEQSLVDMRPELKSRVRAILMISGHWEEIGFAISTISSYAKRARARVPRASTPGCKMRWSARN